MRDFSELRLKLNLTAKLANQKNRVLFLSFPMKAPSPSLFDLVHIVQPQCESGVSL